MKKNLSKPHSVLAAFFDIYVTLIFLAAIIGLIHSFTQRVLINPLFVLGASFIVLVTYIFYHWRLKNKTSFLTFGEQFSGKEIHENTKEWLNPY
jgi:hypothetical protein